MKPTPTNAFMMGFFFHIGYSMAVQDWLGLERYIQLCRDNWLDLHWTVGALIAALCLWGFSSIHVKFQHGSRVMVGMYKELAKLKGIEL